MPETRIPVVVRHSPIEFVVSGPFGGRDRVLVRTENAGLDLVALSAQIQELGGRRRRQSDLFFGLLGAGRQVQAVSSMPIPDFVPEVDSRRSRLSFAWAGLSSHMGMERVKEALNAGLPDIHAALNSGGADEIEYAVAPIVLTCSEMHEGRLRSARFMRIILVAYAIIGIASAAYFLGRGQL